MTLIYAWLQIIGGLILSLGWIPQIIQILRTKSVKDLNVKSYLLVLLGISLMETYAVHLVLTGVGIAFFITNTLSLLIILWLVILIFLYR
ncbi:PQ-loop domain-containing transporter [Hazenella coriacea]|nr:PQ-loop domain-containing transporter [Hazenella coriacea]